MTRVITNQRARSLIECEQLKDAHSTFDVCCVSTRGCFSVPTVCETPLSCLVVTIAFDIDLMSCGAGARAL